MEYFLQGQFVWGCFALSFTILPAGVIQMFSLRWYHSDGSIKNIHWLLHFLFLGVLHRYYFLPKFVSVNLQLVDMIFLIGQIILFLGI